MQKPKKQKSVGSERVQGILFGLFFGMVVGAVLGFFIDPHAGPIMFGFYGAILCSLVFCLLFGLSVNNTRIKKALNVITIGFFTFIVGGCLLSVIKEILR